MSNSDNFWKIAIIMNRSAQKLPIAVAVMHNQEYRPLVAKDMTANISWQMCHTLNDA
jgi:hypothetical protein